MDYQDFSTLLHDAVKSEWDKGFLLNQTLTMYLYLHPCAYRWLNVSAIQTNATPTTQQPLHGHYSNDKELLWSMLDSIRLHGGVQCIQHLIDIFKEASGQEWKRKYPGFHPLPFHSSENTTCEPYSDDQLARQCDTRHPSIQYTDLSTLLEDASREGPAESKFLLNLTLSAFQYLHPCASDAVAALVMFYDLPLTSAVYMLSNKDVNALPLIGRRRRAILFRNDFELLVSVLDRITTHDGVQCIQHLIDTYKAESAQAWKEMYPNFETSNLANRTVSALTASTTTTTFPTTTTSFPTTTATLSLTPTTYPSSTITILTTRASSPTTSSQHLFTYGPATCYECSGLTCLLNPTAHPCSTAAPLCYTRTEDSPVSARMIRRGCTEPSACSVPSDVCRTAEDGVLPEGTACTFCCSGTKCNDPFIVIPRSGRYPVWS